MSNRELTDTSSLNKGENAMKTRASVITTVLLALLFGRLPGAAEELPNFPPNEIVKLITKTIPANWTCENERGGLVVRPRQQPAFVNLINASAQLPNESLQDYYRRHSVRFDYRITLKFAPKLTQEQVQQVENANHAIRERLAAIERSPGVTWGKGEFFFPKSADGQKLANEYFQLNRSIKALPDGSLGAFSVYVDSTFLGYARFLDPAVEQECTMVKKQLLALLTPNANVAPNKR